MFSSAYVCEVGVLPASGVAANWIITLTSSEQWRSERKEGRGKKCSLLGQTCVLHRRQDESSTIKNV